MKYGFELEGFAQSGGRIIVPPKEWPVDGFPGLVEIRTSGGGNLEDQLGCIVAGIIKLPTTATTDFIFNLTEHKFSGDEMSYMRKNRHFDKDRLDVRNIYGKAARRLGNKTLASFQINISNNISEIRTERSVVDGKIVERFIPAVYGPFDTALIVSNLDKEFKEEIKASGRQPGMYSIKDNCRLEYRSLPNSVFSFAHITALANRIRSAVEGKKEE